jgi:enoyl-CoA hydratase/carnithine racemase
MEQTYAELQAIQDVTRRMVHLPKIIIAAVNGIAVGIGVEISLAWCYVYSASSGWARACDANAPDW